MRPLRPALLGKSWTARRRSGASPGSGRKLITSAGAVSYWPSWHPEVGVDVEEQCDDEGAAA
ncbi:hypothetical protein [Bradyrhizobium sp. CIR3A]|uniref:hypothetical protein n=1 Tax=Bradyrhizobium sp. CIR3A TaxID=2663838 RepID=UPI0016056445|nr:hypothetical protein [Bradyrhizobium sp. CIR3A]MBB4257309.1 hypothetical protein [Bradyrhizobium sp. CIR3A]